MGLPKEARIYSIASNGLTISHSPFPIPCSKGANHGL